MKLGSASAGSFFIRPDSMVKSAAAKIPATEDKFFFNAYDDVHGGELWVTDFSTTSPYTRLVKEIARYDWRGARYGFVHQAKLYFLIDDGECGSPAVPCALMCAIHSDCVLTVVSHRSPRNKNAAQGYRVSSSRMASSAGSSYRRIGLASQKSASSNPLPFASRSRRKRNL